MQSMSAASVSATMCMRVCHEILLLSGTINLLCIIKLPISAFYFRMNPKRSPTVTNNANVSVVEVS